MNSSDFCTKRDESHLSEHNSTIGSAHTGGIGRLKIYNDYRKGIPVFPSVCVK